MTPPVRSPACPELRDWWDTFLAQGQGFDYHPHACKIHLIFEGKFFDKAKRLFDGTNVNITVQGKRHLGAAIGPAGPMSDKMTQESSLSRGQNKHMRKYFGGARRSTR